MLIILEMLVITIGSFSAVYGIFFLVNFIIEKASLNAIVFSLLLLNASFLCFYFEVSTDRIIKHELKLTDGSIHNDRGFYTLSFFSNGYRDLKTSDANVVELIQNSPKNICIVHHNKVNIFGSASWAADSFEIKRCEQIGE